MHKPRRFVIICKPIYIFVPCRFGYQFIFMFSSILLFIYFFYLPNKLYIIIIKHRLTLLWILLVYSERKLYIKI